MKKTIALLSIIVLIAGCSGMGASTGLTPEQEAAIPAGSNTVVASSTLSQAELYAELLDALNRAEYPILRENEALFQVITENVKLDRRVVMQLQLTVILEGRASRLLSRGSWALDTSTDAFGTAFSGGFLGEEGEPIVWGETERGNYLYAKMVLLAQDVPNDGITHETR